MNEMNLYASKGCAVPAEMTYDCPPSGEPVCPAGPLGIPAIPRLPCLPVKALSAQMFDTSQGPSKIIAVLPLLKSLTMLPPSLEFIFVGITLYVFCNFSRNSRPLTDPL